MPSKRKKKWGKKSEKRGEERKRQVKVKTAVSLLNPKTISTFCFLHMPELRKLIIILHLDQKAVKCTTCKWPTGKFKLFIARQWLVNHSTSFKTRFLAKSPGENGLKYASPSCLACSWLASKRKWSLTSCVRKNIFFNATGHTYFSHATGHTSPSCYVAHLPLFCKIFFWL